MIYSINHRTSYNYHNHVSLCHNLVHLTARNCPSQTCLQSDLHLSSPPAVFEARADYFGNPVTFFTVQEPHKKLDVIAINVVQMHPRPVPNADESTPWEDAREALKTDRDPRTLDAYQFVFESQYVKPGPELATYAAPSFLPGRPLLDSVLDLTRRIFHEFRFDPRATTIETPISELLQTRRGVCQDFAHLEIGCLRSLGLAARYVSGYLLTTPPPGQVRLIGSDVSHAWLAVFCPGAGWVDIDPTNNMVPSNQHITLAWGRDYDDVSPLKGVILGGGRHTVSVAVDVARSPEAGRAG